MWMRNGGDTNELNMNDSLNLTKFSPINPNLFIKASCSRTTSTTLPPYNTGDFAGLNNHLDNSARDGQNDHRQAYMGSSTSTSRWNPTAEQLLALEEMYRLGIRTPTADQIQQIATHLRRFGKIEGKNVFYWFQNHKARDRKKRRRQVETSRIAQKHDTTLDEKESGLRRAAHELEQKKGFVHPSNCSSRHLELEGLVSMHRSSATEEESRTHGRSKYDYEKELQQKSNNQVERKRAMCSAVDLSSSPPPIPPITTIAITSSPSKFLNSNQWQSSSVLLKPKKGNGHSKLEDYQEIRAVQIQTLELFPLCSDIGANDCSEKDRKVPIKTINTNWSPSQFFEFLPLKN